MHWLGDLGAVTWAVFEVAELTSEGRGGCDSGMFCFYVVLVWVLIFVCEEVLIEEGIISVL